MNTRSGVSARGNVTTHVPHEQGSQMQEVPDSRGLVGVPFPHHFIPCVWYSIGQPSVCRHLLDARLGQEEAGSRQRSIRGGRSGS